MFWINAISTDGSPQERCLVFESFTIAQVMADKLERDGFVTQILDHEFRAFTEIPKDPFRHLLGIHRLDPSRARLNHWTLEILYE